MNSVSTHRIKASPEENVKLLATGSEGNVSVGTYIFCNSGLEDPQLL